MKKFKVSVGALLMAGGSLMFSSCIGSFNLTNEVLAWNKQVGPKFLNEIVFVAFWILPVYEVTGLADLFVLNSIEFWKKKNPYEASVRFVETRNGQFTIQSDSTGYLITCENTGVSTRFNYNEETQTWAVINDGQEYPFLSFMDDSEVRMITPNGEFMAVELSEEGVQAYIKTINECLMLQASR